MLFDIELENGGLKRNLVIPETTDAMIRVEGNFKFFEIETLLRNICYDTFEPLRQWFIKECEPGKFAK